MNAGFEYNADANARLAMLDKMNRDWQAKRNAAQGPSGNPTAKHEAARPAHPARELTTDGSFRVRPVSRQEESWQSEEIVVSFGTA